MGNGMRELINLKKMTEELDNSIKKVLTTEVKYVIAIVMFIVGVVAPYYSIKEDVALIKENHYTHIEQIYKEMGELKADQLRNEEKYNQLLGLIYQK